MLPKRLTLLVLLMTIFTNAIGLSPAQAQDPAVSIPVIEHDPHFAVEWMELLYDRIRAEGQNPPLAARTYAYAGITLYEALLNGIPENSTLAGQITHMPDMPLPAEDTVYDWLVVANHALYRVLSELVPINPETEAESLTALTKHYDAVNAEREAEVGAGVIEDSIMYADELADTILEWIAADNLEYIRGLPEYQIPDYGEMGWVLTSEGTVVSEPYWGQIRPFMLEYPSECSVPMNIEFSTEPGSTFYLQAVEVQEWGNNLTPEQSEMTISWVDAPRLTGTPGGHWILIAGQMVDHLDLTLDRTAEMYALVGMAAGDAFISAWEAKYRYMLIRPVTYIQRHIRRSWEPLVQTPPFPEYPSGHSVVSQAAATVLTSLFGTVAFTDNSPLMYDYQPRSFTSFQAAATEAALSRIYGGIHYRIAVENGMEQGRCVGNKIAENVRLNPFRQGE